jgi:tripartite-type tricarboxylate transporter receptor subunit TctC
MGTTCAAVVLSLLTSAHAQQDYPSRPVRMIVLSVADGGTDSSTRIVVANLGDTLGQRVIVDNRPAAGTEIVNPDGAITLSMSQRWELQRGVVGPW